MTDPTFANQVVETRKALGLTQAALGAGLGTTTQTISNWETGRVVPWPKTQVDVLLKLLRWENATAREAQAPAPSPHTRIIDRI